MDDKVIKPHGGYQGLQAYQMAEIVHDVTAAFTRLYLDSRSRTVDQMVQAARSGKQNIVEGSVASGTSSKIELKLVGIARASLEELLTDYRDFLRQNGHELRAKDHEKTQFIRRLACREDRSYRTCKTYIEEKGAANAANTMVCLVHQTNFLLDRLLVSLEESFKTEGGFTERLHRVRTAHRSRRLEGE